jgi:hypothetical protein
MQDRIESIFLDWLLTLDKAAQDNVSFDHFDYGIHILFLKRTEAFDRRLLKTLASDLKQLDTKILVSTIKVPEL